MAASECDDCCCFVGILLKILIFIFGCGLIVFMAIYHRPNTINSRVTHASLTEFNFTPNHTLHYNLALNITLRNPNKHYGVRYDNIEVLAYYKDQRFGFGMANDLVNSSTPFKQGHKSTSLVTPSFKGQHSVLLGDEELSKFKAASNFDIVVKLSVGNDYYTSRLHSRHTKLFSWKGAESEMTCHLNVPLITSNTTTYNNIDHNDQQSAAKTSFQTTDCIKTYTSLPVPHFLSICFFIYFILLLCFGGWFNFLLAIAAIVIYFKLFIINGVL